MGVGLHPVIGGASPRLRLSDVFEAQRRAFVIGEFFADGGESFASGDRRRRFASGFERGASLFVVVRRSVDEVCNGEPMSGTHVVVVGDVDNRLFELRGSRHISR